MPLAVPRRRVGGGEERGIYRSWVCDPLPRGPEGEVRGITPTSAGRGGATNCLCKKDPVGKCRLFTHYKTFILLSVSHYAHAVFVQQSTNYIRPERK